MAKRSLESFISELDGIRRDLLGDKLGHDKSDYFNDEDLIIKIKEAFYTIEDSLEEQIRNN
tara:strand:+ start:611 stop:793 length:183 start_codon:yes stop_codon:yes gene_type:complete